jgi:hypothetical protein
MSSKKSPCQINSKHRKNLEIMTTKNVFSFTLIFVLAGIIILVPNMTEKVLATINAKLFNEIPGQPTLKLVGSHLDKGAWVSTPSETATHSTPATWATKGTGIIGGDERGTVTYELQGTHVLVTVFFENPTSGSNHCDINRADPPLTATCSITQGNHATATYIVK